MRNPPALRRKGGREALVMAEKQKRLYLITNFFFLRADTNL